MEKRVQLTSSLVLQMLGDHELYRTCPIYLFMMDNGLAISKQFRELNEAGKKCVGCTERAIKHTLGTFAMQTRLAARVQPRYLEALLQYLTAKLGYVVGSASLYYTDAKSTQMELRFGPAIAGYVKDLPVEQGGSDGQVRATSTDAASPGHDAGAGAGVST